MWCDASVSARGSNHAFSQINCSAMSLINPTSSASSPTMWSTLDPRVQLSIHVSAGEWHYESYYWTGKAHELLNRQWWRYVKHLVSVLINIHKPRITSQAYWLNVPFTSLIFISSTVTIVRFGYSLPGNRTWVELLWAVTVSNHRRSSGDEMHILIVCSGDLNLFVYLMFPLFDRWY